MIPFLAQAAPPVAPSTQQWVGVIVGTPIILLLVRIIHDLIKVKMPAPGSKNGKIRCNVDNSTVEKVGRIYDIVGERGVDGAKLVHFPASKINSDHEKQLQLVREITASQERVASTLDRIEARNCPRGAKK